VCATCLTKESGKGKRSQEDARPCAIALIALTNFEQSKIAAAIKIRVIPPLSKNLGLANYNGENERQAKSLTTDIPAASKKEG
jgi:hypothetical protein